MSESNPPVMEIEFMDGTRYTVRFGDGRDDARDWHPKPEGLMIRRNPAGSERTIYPWGNIRTYTILCELAENSETAPVTTSTYHIQADTPKTPAAEWEKVNPKHAFHKLLTDSIARRLPASWVSNSDNRARLREAVQGATEGWFISHHRIPGENSETAWVSACELERLMARLPWRIAEPRPQEPPL